MDGLPGYKSTKECVSFPIEPSQSLTSKTDVTAVHHQYGCHVALLLLCLHFMHHQVVLVHVVRPLLRLAVAASQNAQLQHELHEPFHAHKPCTSVILMSLLHEPLA